MTPRPYQQAAIDALYDYWVKHPAITDCPIISAPTGSGKSLIIAELVRLLFDTWPTDHPRTVVIVPSKELAEQNAEKLAKVLPPHLTIGYYSASLGRKMPTADVIVATIGSVAKNAHVLGNIRCVVVDECHAINSDGAGMYRKFLSDLSKYCVFRVVGLTATPFRGNGISLTDGKDPLFTGIAYQIQIQELIDGGFLSPLVRPVDVQTRIDTDNVKITNGDYNLNELSERVDNYITNAVIESKELAKDRKKWIAFTPTVETAEHLVKELINHGITAAVVCGSTKKQEREHLIAQFRAGNIRCLVTVIALATGFDVPDIDCILYLRPTKSPVLYIQAAGRGMRTAPGKTDCLWLDFSDTTDRLGPIDLIRGRRKSAGHKGQGAPFAVCNNCGEQVRPASTLFCPECGEQLREDKEKEISYASNSAILANQIEPVINEYEVTEVKYRKHVKEGSQASLRVDYWSRFRVVASEWICLQHKGFAKGKAEQWWTRWMPDQPIPDSIDEAVFLCYENAIRPNLVVVNNSGKYPAVVKLMG